MTAREYAKPLKRQNVVLGIVLVLSVALIIFLGETGWLDSRDWTRAAEGTQKLLFVWQGWMIWRIVHNRRLLREPGEMKQYMVEKNDERRDMRSGGPTLCDDIHGGDEHCVGDCDDVQHDRVLHAVLYHAGGAGDVGYIESLVQ